MGSIFKLVKNWVSVNPTLKESSFKVGQFRLPPGSFKQQYIEPKGPADKLSKNYYYDRDVRRNYPKTAVYSQADVATLLAAPSTQSISDGEAGSKLEPVTELVTKSLPETLAQIKVIDSASDRFLPPIPHQRYRYQVSEETYENVPGRYWPTYLVK